MQPTVLIVEDDERIAALVSKNLEAAGLHSHVVHRGDEALEQFTRLSPALVLLDILLPGTDGLELIRQIRRTSTVPIMMLTARSSEAEKVLGFELGADDYVTKPFSTRELIARARALLRRTASEGERTLERGELQIDVGRRAVAHAGEAVEITSLEFDLLYFLAQRPGRVFSRQALMDQVWGEGRVVDDRSIDSLISRLRRKLEPDPAKPRYVQTVWGAGYRFGES
jgi:DNA-binding response OmpR family regulator